MEVRKLVFAGAACLVSVVPVLQAETAEDEEQLHFVYIGASTCGMCKTPEMKEAVQQAREIFRRQAEASGVSFVAVGVAAEADVEKGLGFLAGYGTFDQLVVGGGFENLAMMEYVWSQQPPSQDSLPNQGIPQIVVASRRFREAAGRIVPLEFEVLGYMVGNIIPHWVKMGAPLKPPSESGTTR
jgi:hypothetical protein